MIGRTLGNYRIIEQIGTGGMATVYKAYAPDTDRYVAIKVLPEYYSQDPTFRERFRREAKAIARLEHMNILPIHAYGEEEGIAYLVMRYMETGTLADRIAEGPLPLEEANRLLGQIAGALDHAHQNGILHRDVKPSNVLLDSSGNAYLTDFGIAKMVEGVPDLTGTGTALGTPQYMSPEQCRGIKDLTPASDIYSLGVVLYQMLTGRVPFEADTPIAVIHMHLNDPLPLPRAVRPDLPEGVERVILKALAKNPAQRFPRATDMSAAFARALGTSPQVPALPADYQTQRDSSTDARAAQRGGGNLWPVIIGGLAFLVVIACLVAAALLTGIIPFGLGSEGQATAQAMSEAGEPIAAPTELPLPTPTKTPIPTATPTPVTITPETPGQLPPIVNQFTLDNGWTRYEVIGEGFAIALPPGWQSINMDPATIQAAMEAAAESNPQFAPFLEGQLPSLMALGIKFFGFDLSPEATLSGYATNVNVGKQPLGMQVTLDVFVDTNLAMLESILNIQGDIERQRVTLPVGEAEQLQYHLPLATPTGQNIDVIATQYLLIVDEDAYVITFGTTNDLLSSYQADFEEIANSFAVLE